MLLALKADKPRLSQSPTEKVEGVQIWRSRVPEEELISAKQSLREERILERCHFIMDVL